MSLQPPNLCTIDREIFTGYHVENLYTMETFQRFMCSRLSCPREHWEAAVGEELECQWKRSNGADAYHCCGGDA